MAPRSRIWRFLRNCLTGGVATAVYFAVYLPMYYWGGWPQAVADNVGLLVGAAVQFLGARYFVFRARHGSIPKQLAGFALAECATLLMNVLLLWVARWAMPAEVGRSDLLVLATSFIVFAGFSYPIWHLVFKTSVVPRVTAPDEATSVS